MIAPRPGDSPFSPSGVQYAWDSTSLGWLKTCPRYYQYSMLDGWRSKGESVHLRFGLVYHAALELYDTCRVGYQRPAMDHAGALREAVRYSLTHTWDNGAPWLPDHPSKTRDNLIRSVIWYLDQFGEADPAQTITLSNGRPAVELSFRLPIGDELVLSGHLDRVAIFQGEPYVLDRKTTSTTLSPYYFERYAPDNQMTIYTIAAKVVFSVPVKGVVIDAAQIAVGFTRFSRGMTHRTEGQLAEWLDELPFWHSQAKTMTALGRWPMNDKSCDKFGGCVFRGICNKDPHVRQAFLETEFTRDPWNPLVAR